MTDARSIHFIRVLRGNVTRRESTKIRKKKKIIIKYFAPRVTVLLLRLVVIVELHRALTFRELHDVERYNKGETTLTTAVTELVIYRKS